MLSPVMDILIIIFLGLLIGGGALARLLLIKRENPRIMVVIAIAIALFFIIWAIIDYFTV
jgi:hypothetical protein